MFWLVLIVAVGTLLRFYNFQDIPYTPDEFSALGRLKFDSIGDVLEFGVKPDGHPAGVQVFLYYWTNWFGNTEMVVKFPFLAMGIGAIIYAFAIGKKWFNVSVGLMVASFIATLQIAVMYSQIARPYGSGLFLSLAMVYYWTKIILNNDKLSIYDGSMYVLFSALCAYNHHFSLLFAAIVGFTGIAIGANKHRLQFLFAGLLIFTLYIPHLPIFFAQLHTAGIGSWLAAPKPDFFINYISYIFHFSWILVVFTVVLLIIMYVFKFQVGNQKFAWISLTWFMLPFIIGYYYSIYRAPLLQYSVLIFSFPFVLFFLFGWAKEKSAKMNGMVVILILATGSGTLIFERQHYEQFYYREMFKQQVIEIPNMLDKLGAQNCQVIIANHQEIVDHYFAKYAFNFDYVHFISTQNKVLEIENLADTCTKNFIVLGILDNQPKELIQIIRHYYPFIYLKKNYINSNLWVFSKSPNPAGLVPYFEIENNFKSVDTNWFGYDQNALVNDGVTSKLKISHEQEFGVGTEIEISKWIRHQYDVIELRANVEFFDTSMAEVLLVADVFSEKGNLLWRAGNSLDFRKENKLNQSIYLAIDYNVIDAHTNEKIFLKTYIWNKDNQNFYLYNFNIQIREGNREKYAIWEKF